MKSNPRLLLLLMLVAVLAFEACQNNCQGVLCSPVPPLLSVRVLDTLTVDTTLVVLRGMPVRADTVDTMLVVSRYTRRATVTLDTIRGGDTNSFITLNPPTAPDIYYTYNNKDSLPSGPFIIRARRDGRFVAVGGALVRYVTGCCPYWNVGLFTLNLPNR